MTATLADLVTRMGRYIDDVNVLFNNAAQEAFLEQAARRYEQHKPHRVDLVITGDGSTREFALTVALGSWRPQFSEILEIEYPLAQDPIQLIDLAESTNLIEGIENAAPAAAVNARLFLFTTTIPALDTARVRITTNHVVATGTAGTTIPDHDADAFAALGASIWADGLASYYAESNRSTVGVDVVDWQSKSVEFKALSRSLVGIYMMHVLGHKDPNKNRRPMIRGVDLDVRSVFGNRDLFVARRGDR